MKKMIIGLSLISSISAFAASGVTYKSTRSSSANTAYEVVLTGDVANALYQALKGRITPVSGWTNKEGNGIICGKHPRQGFACSMVVDEAGVNL